MQKLYGKIFSYSESPRANIFRESYLNATTQDSILTLMRENNLTSQSTDSENSDEEHEVNVIDEKYWSMLGVRWDLEIKIPFGVIDTKVVTGEY